MARLDEKEAGFLPRVWYGMNQISECDGGLLHDGHSHEHNFPFATCSSYTRFTAPAHLIAKLE